MKPGSNSASAFDARRAAARLMALLEMHERRQSPHAPLTAPWRSDPFDRANDPFLEVPMILENPFGVPPPPPIPLPEPKNPPWRFTPRG